MDKVRWSSEESKASPSTYVWSLCFCSPELITSLTIPFWSYDAQILRNIEGFLYYFSFCEVSANDSAYPALNRCRLLL